MPTTAPILRVLKAAAIQFAKLVAIKLIQMKQKEYSC